MNELVLIAVFLGNMSITSYRSVPEQTDSSPFITSTGDHVHRDGVALSRNLLKRWGGAVEYGDVVYIEGVGFKVANDCLAPRHKDWVDVWVPTLQDEQKFHGEWKGRKTRVWLVKKQ